MTLMGIVWKLLRDSADSQRPDGKQLALMSAARTSVLIVDAQTGQQVKQITDPRIHTIAGVHWSPDDSRLALETMDSASNSMLSLSTWNIVTGKQRYVFPYNDCAEARWSPDSKYLSCIQSEKTGSGNKISYFQQILIWAA